MPQRSNRRCASVSFFFFVVNQHILQIIVKLFGHETKAWNDTVIIHTACVSLFTKRWPSSGPLTTVQLYQKTFWLDSCIEVAERHFDFTETRAATNGYLLQKKASKKFKVSMFFFRLCFNTFPRKLFSNIGECKFETLEIRASVLDLIFFMVHCCGCCCSSVTQK